MTAVNRSAAIAGRQAIEITGLHSVSVQGAVSEELKSGHRKQVTGDYYLKGMNVVIEAMTGLTIKVGGNFITINPGGIQINGAPAVIINSVGAALSGSPAALVPAMAPAEVEIADNAAPGDSAPSYKSQRQALSAAERAAIDAPSHDPVRTRIGTGTRTRTRMRTRRKSIASRSSW